MIIIITTTHQGGILAVVFSHCCLFTLIMNTFAPHFPARGEKHESNFNIRTLLKNETPGAIFSTAAESCSFVPFPFDKADTL